MSMITRLVAGADAFGGIVQNPGGGTYLTIVEAIAGRVAHWRFNGGATDEVGSLDLTAVGGPSFAGADLPPNSSGGSMSVTPTQYGEAAHGAALDLAAATLVAWCRPASLHDGAIVSKRLIAPTAAADQDFTMRLAADGHVRCFATEVANPEGGTQYAVSPAGFYAANDTLCIALLFGGGVGLTLYVNGELIDINSDYILGWDNNVSPLRIGYAGYNDHPFNGLIDEVIVWNRRLTQDELRIVAQASPVAFDFNMGSTQATGPAITEDLANHIEALSTASYSHSPISSNFGAWSRTGSDITYTPSNSGNGIDSCFYTITDDIGQDSGVVSATVQAAAGGGDPLALLFPYTSTDNVNAGSSSLLASAVNGAPPGRHVKVTANLLSLGTVTLTGNGTEAAPIVIRPDGALLSRTLSNGRINLDGSYLVLAGFNLDAVEIRMRGHHNRVTRNNMDILGADTAVEITGDDNRVDHNDLSEMTNTGIPGRFGFQIQPDWFSNPKILPRRNLFDRNYLHDTIDQGETNGHEAFGVGQNTGDGLYDTGARIEYNLVSAWHAEGETNSVKAPYAHLIGNTIINCHNWGSRSYSFLSEGEWVESCDSFRIRSGTHTKSVGGEVIPATIIRDLRLVGTPMDFFQGDISIEAFEDDQEAGQSGSPNHVPAVGAIAYNVVSDNDIRVGRGQGPSNSFTGIAAANNRLERPKRPGGTDMTIGNGITTSGAEYNSTGTVVQATTSEPSTPAVKLTISDVGINANDPLDTLNGGGPPSW